MVLSMDKQSVGCEIDAVGCNNLPLLVVKLADAQPNVRAVDGHFARRKRVMSGALLGLPVALSFYRPVVHFLWNRFNFPSLSEMERHGTVLKLSER